MWSCDVLTACPGWTPLFCKMTAWDGHQLSATRNGKVCKRKWMDSRICHFLWMWYVWCQAIWMSVLFVLYTKYVFPHLHFDLINTLICCTNVCVALFLFQLQSSVFLWKPLYPSFVSMSGMNNLFPSLWQNLPITALHHLSSLPIHEFLCLRGCDWSLMNNWRHYQSANAMATNKSVSTNEIPVKGMGTLFNLSSETRKPSGVLTCLTVDCMVTFYTPRSILDAFLNKWIQLKLWWVIKAE